MASFTKGSRSYVKVAPKVRFQSCGIRLFIMGFKTVPCPCRSIFKMLLAQDKPNHRPQRTSTMLSNFPNSTVLLKDAIKSRLYQKLVAQLGKDFGLANVAVDFQIDMVPEELRSILHEKIYYLIMERFSDYLNLLYVIDVPEKAFKEIHVTDVVEVAEQVSFLILKRELQKVWLKERFGS
jgi:hypothetical protein